MCGNKSVFVDLDESFQNTVKFGDSYVVPTVMGRGRVKFQTKANSIQTISNVLFIPSLKTNLLSLGQLQDKGYKINIEDGKYRVQDSKQVLIAQAKMTKNRMFPLYIHHVTHSCLFTTLKGTSWL